MDNKTGNVMIMDHPLIKHKISLLRDKNTGTGEFRSLVEEIAMLMAFESLRSLPTEEIEIETPIEKCMAPVISGKKLAVVPILRAGLGMVDGILKLVPSAKVGHIGLCRNEETHLPQEYYCKLPQMIEQREVIVLDPMLATGGSAAAAIDMIKADLNVNSRFNVKFQSTDRIRAIRYLDQYCQFVKWSNAAKEMNSMTPADIENSTNFIILILSFNEVLPFRFRHSGISCRSEF